jgi:hypothetical protein
MHIEDESCYYRYLRGVFLGTYYGYANCCVKAFIDGNLTYNLPEWKGREEQLPLYGTGFIPCAECAKKDADLLRVEIIARRGCSLTFPADLTSVQPNHPEREAFVKALKHFLSRCREDSLVPYADAP